VCDSLNGLRNKKKKTYDVVLKRFDALEEIRMQNDLLDLVMLIAAELDDQIGSLFAN